jgi:hypothetical protein
MIVTLQRGTIRGTIIVGGTIKGTIILAHRPPKPRMAMRWRTITALGDDILGILSVLIPRLKSKEIDNPRVTRIYRPHRPPIALHALNVGSPKRKYRGYRNSSIKACPLSLLGQRFWARRLRYDPSHPDATAD